MHCQSSCDEPDAGDGCIELLGQAPVPARPANVCLTAYRRCRRKVVLGQFPFGIHHVACMAKPSALINRRVISVHMLCLRDCSSQPLNHSRLKPLNQFPVEHGDI